MTLKMQTGFLPEPIPTADVSEDRLRDEIDKVKSGALASPIAQSPLFGTIKCAAFRRQCGNLTVEQAMARFEDVFDAGIDKANIEIELSDARALARKIGDEETSGSVADMLDNARLFRRWITDVIEAIVRGHYPSYGTPQVAVAVPHLDVPLDDGDTAKVAIIYGRIYDDEENSYKTVAHMLSIPWPGRHVLRVEETWVDYIVVLMRMICSLSA